jgi:hypothetical protein
MVYYSNGRKLQIGLFAHETNDDKIIFGGARGGDECTGFVTNIDGETIDTTDGVYILGHDWVIILETDDTRVITRDQAREGVSNDTRRGLAVRFVRRTFRENAIEFIDGDVTVVGRVVGVNICGE